jgi:hypothetical protein
MRVQRVLAVAVVFLFLLGLGFGQTHGRTEHVEKYTIEVEGQDLGSCGDFNVWTDYVVLVHEVWLFDKDGQPVKAVNRYKAIGQSLYYNSNDRDLFLLGAPGETEIDHIDVEDGTISITGIPFKIRVPGYGPIYYETGRVILDLNTGEWLNNTGHNQFVDQDLEAVCKCLTP